MSSAVYLCIYELCSFSNFSVTSRTSQLISNTSVALPTSRLILQPFRCFTYVKANSPTLLSHLLRHWLFTYVTWRTAYVVYNSITNYLHCTLLIHQYFVLNLQLFRHFTYITTHFQPYVAAHSPTLPLLHLRQS